MSVSKILFAVSDGILDDLARKSIVSASKVYYRENPVIYLASYESEVSDSDPIFNMVSDNVKIVRFTLTREDLSEVTPNVINKKFDSGDGLMKSHWDNALETNQYLANFSDLVIFYLMIKEPETDFLYIDSDMICMKPLLCEKLFVAAYDKGENDSLYINASLIFVPKGHQNIKERWVSMLENEILEKYKFRYGMIGPVAFDKFLNRPDNIKGFKMISIPYEQINPISFLEIYKASVKSIEKNKPLCIDIDHNGPILNIPRSGVTTAITHCNSESLELLLGITNNEGAQLMSIEFFPKNISGIEYYEKLK